MAAMQRVTVDKRGAPPRAPEPAGQLREPLLQQEPPLLSDGPPTAEQHQRRRLLSAGVAVAKTILGVGVLALPRVFSLLGLGAGAIWLLFLALLTYYSLHVLCHSTARTGIIGYSDMVREHLGLVAQVVLDVSTIANCFGLMVVMLVVVGDILVGAGSSEGLLSPECGDRRTVLAVVTLLLLAPLVSARRTSTTTAASALGVVAILVWAAVTLLLFLLAASNGQLHTMHWWPTSPTFKSKGFESAVQMVGVLPVLVVAFLCQMSVGHTMRDLSYIEERTFDNVSLVAVSLATVAFLILSVCSYGLFGSRVHADVLASFSVKALTPIVWSRLAQACFMLVRLAFLVSLVVSFPLQMGPGRDALWKLLFRQELQGPGLWLVTYLALFAVYWAAAYISSIWGPLIALGSTAGVIIAFIMPGLLAAAIRQDLVESDAARRSRVIGGLLLAFVGFVIGLAGLLRIFMYRDPVSD